MLKYFSILIIANKVTVFAVLFHEDGEEGGHDFVFLDFLSVIVYNRQTSNNTKGGVF